MNYSGGPHTRSCGNSETRKYTQHHTVMRSIRLRVVYWCMYQSILAFITFAQSCILFFNRLLLSIDRRQSVEEAMDTVHLAVEYNSHVSSEHYTRVVGIDLSGDPKVRVVCILNG